MIINTNQLEKELLKEEIISKFEEKVLERFTISQLKEWKKENWELEILGTLGFSLSSVVEDFLELNKSYFDNNTDYKWEAYIDKVLNSFVNGKFIDPFKDIECEPFFNVIDKVSDILNERILAQEETVLSQEEILCPHCNCDLKDTGFYSKRPLMFMFNDKSEKFELAPLLSDEDFDVYCCECDNKLDCSEYEITENIF